MSGTTAAIAISKQRGITDITTSELNRFSNKFVAKSRVHAQVRYERAGNGNSQRYVFTAQFTSHVDSNYLEKLLQRISHPYAIEILGLSQPAPQGFHNY